MRWDRHQLLWNEMGCDRKICPIDKRADTTSSVCIWILTTTVPSPIFVKFSLFLISTHSENLIHLTLMVLKFKILEDPVEEDSLTWHPRFQSHKSPS